MRSPIVNVSGGELCLRIRDSLINAINFFATENKIELIPIIDRFLLLFQKNIGLEIIRVSSGAKVFSFVEKLKDEKLERQFFEKQIDLHVGRIVFDTEAYDIFVYFFHTESEILPLLSYDLINMRQLLRLINEVDSGELTEYLRNGLMQAFADCDKKTSQMSEATIEYSLMAKDLDGPIAKECREQIRVLLDECLGGFTNPLLYNSKFKMPSFFAVLRYAYKRDDYPYTAQILLSKVQKKAVEKYLQEYDSYFLKRSSYADEKDYVSLLEKPLAAGSNSLADRCFTLDTVQFGLHYHRDDSGRRQSEIESIRPRLEGEIYREMLDGDRPHSVFFVPIHVNGCAWLALYQIFRRERSSYDKAVRINQWFATFEIYNQCILLIAEKIRFKAKEVFSKLIHETIDKAVSKAGGLSEFITMTDESFKIISCFFTYPVPSFKPTSFTNSISSFLETLSEDAVELCYNSLWHNTVEYDRINKAEQIATIVAHCRRVGQDLKHSEETEEKISISYRISHFYKNQLTVLEKPVMRVLDHLREKMPFSEKDESLLKDYKGHFKRLNEISSLLNLISKQYADKKNRGMSVFEFEKSDDYRHDTLYDWRQTIWDLFELHKKKYQRLVFQELVSIKIKPYFNKSNNWYRPYDVLYYNLTVEIMTNFFNQKQELLTVSRVKHEKEELVCFTNKTMREKKRVYNYEWEIVSSQNFSGAILYLSILLQETMVGSMYYRFADTRDSQIVEFSLGVHLKGINYEL